MTTSLGKLQTTVTKLEKKIIQQRERIEDLTNERNQLKKKIKELESLIDEKIEKAVAKASESITEKYEKIIQEKDQRIFELENRLNINSTNSSLPSSKNPIYQSKICNSRKPTDKSIGGQQGHPKSKLKKFKDD